MGSNTSLQHNFARVRMKWGWLTCFVWRPDWAPSDTKLCWMGQGCWGWWSVGFSTGTKWEWGLDTERDCGGWRRWGWLTRTDAWASWFFRNFISTKCPYPQCAYCTFNPQFRTIWGRPFYPTLLYRISQKNSRHTFRCHAKNGLYFFGTQTKAEFQLAPSIEIIDPKMQLQTPSIP